MRWKRLGRRLGAGVCSVAVASMCAWPMPVRAQSQAEAQARSDLAVSLVEMQPWFDPQTPLRLRIEVTSRSRPLTDTTATLAVHPRVRSRGELARVLTGERAPPVLVERSYEVPDARAGTPVSIDMVNEPPARSLQGLQDGVYPVTVAVSRRGTPRQTLTTAVAILQGPVSPRMSVLTVALFSPTPVLRPDWSVPRNARRRLEGLKRQLESLSPEDSPAVVAVSPLAAEELRVFPAGEAQPAAHAALEALRTVVGRSELATTPLCNCQLPHLDDLDLQLPEQFELGREAVRRAFEADPIPLVMPPDLVVDAETLRALEANGHTASVAAFDAPTGLTPAEALRTGGLTVLPADARINELSSAARSPLDVSRVVAETAMVYFESPGRERTLVLVVDATAPRAADLLSAFRRAPWLQAVSAAQAAASATKRQIPVLRRADRPTQPYRRDLREAREAVDLFASYTLPDNPAVPHFRHALLAAAGTAWWNEDWAAGTASARSVTESVRRQRSLITTTDSGPVTFTSRRGGVPVTVGNRSRYRVRLVVEVESAKLKFPRGRSRALEVSPPGQTVTFPALTEATGTFPVRVTLRTPDGRVVVEQSEITVRSTAANVLALGLTVGAAAFLVLWYAKGRGRRTPRGRAGPPNGATG
ncbi:MAG TPA: DUF6049 family protein [Actinomycetota bacterium]|nr:DUF6049 family protein [Actinomycetota bacterium]